MIRRRPQALGPMDARLGEGAEVDPAVQLARQRHRVLPESVLQRSHDLTRHENLIDGVAPAIVESLAVRTWRLGRASAATLFASDQSHLAALATSAVTTTARCGT
jgi:hypothetical protein